MLYALARQAAERCDQSDGTDAIGAVLLAYAALEAFLNELAHLSIMTLLESKLPREHSAHVAHPEPLLSVLEPFVPKIQAEMNRYASTEDRYDLSWEAFAGTEPSKGQGIRQRLTTLTKIRNAVVHLQSTRTETVFSSLPAAPDLTGPSMAITVQYEQPPFLQSLRGWKLLDGDESDRWVDRISTRMIADWACSTAQSAASELISKTPARSAFRERLASESLGGSQCQPPPANREPVK